MAKYLVIGLLSWAHLSAAHSIFHQSYPTPEGTHHGKSEEWFARIRHDRVHKKGNYKSRFLEQYHKIMNQSSGYLSPQGVPYHSNETLMCEAPDYGHETTSEAFSYFIWLQALYGWANGDWTPFNNAWSLMETMLIPPLSSQNSNGGYNPSSPATYAKEMDSPSDYPVLENYSVAVGVDPLNDELTQVYGSNLRFYATHWLLDVDNIYGFGVHESGNKADRNVFINTFQRGPNESVWRTVPEPEWEIFKYGDPSQCGFIGISEYSTKYPDCAEQYRYTGAPDADARTIQATYWAIQLAKESGGSISDSVSKAQKLGDFVRYASFDKYFKPIPCHSQDCPPTTWSNAYDSCFYLISWYYAWGGSANNQGWAWRIGASHVHQGYQNVMTAYALSTEPSLIGKTSSGKDQWETVRNRTLEFYMWLQSSEGAIAGGATNSWDGSYKDPTQDGITGYFYGLAYKWDPVYDLPPSNNWFGMQAWAMQRVAEYLYVTKDYYARKILDKWWNWIESLKSNILIENNDFQIPSTLNWEGQPDTWTGESSYTGNPNLHVTVKDYAKDMGTGSGLAHCLAFYAAATGNKAAQNMSAELLDRMYAYADEIGIGIPEERPDYIGQAPGAGFNEPVYIPSDYNGKMPNGDEIKPGATFTSIRSWYKSDSMYPIVESALNSGKPPVFTYHRMWAQASFALANADYSRLFES